jgi:glycosyltransferase involved in cell wall biosynthesis
MLNLNSIAELWLIGNWETEEFLKDFMRLKGWEYTLYLGFLKLGKIYSYMKYADVGLCMLHPIERYKICLPTKIFEYMCCSLPAAETDTPYWKKIFNKGVLFADGKNPEDIAKKISILSANKDLRLKMGNEGRTLVEKEYSWEAESCKLVKLYDLLKMKK